MYKYEIDYGYGKAELWTNVGQDEAIGRFYARAGECYGIRKNIGKVTLLTHAKENLPKPWGLLPDATEMLKHTGGDTIVWDSKGEKVKSEWD